MRGSNSPSENIVDHKSIFAASSTILVNTKRDVTVVDKPGSRGRSPVGLREA